MKKLNSIIIALTSFFILSGCSDEIISVKSDSTNTSSSAHHVPLQKAKSQLLEIVSGLNGDVSTRSGASLNDRCLITSATALGKDKKPLTRGNESDAAYYVFRFGDNEGFAIMSADDRLPALLAIASGTPDQNDPTAELPDSNFWVPPMVPDSAKDIEPPITGDDPRFDDFISMANGGLVPVHWGPRKPFNELFEREESVPESYDLIAPGICVALAQVMTASKFKSTKFLKRYTPSHEFIGTDTIDFKALSKVRFHTRFDANPEMKLMVQKLYRWFQNPEALYFYYSLSNAYSDQPLVRPQPNITTSMLPCHPYDPYIWRAMGHLGFSIGLEYNCFIIQHDTDMDVSHIQYEISQGNPVIISGKGYRPTAFYNASIIHDIKYHNQHPQIQYYLINKCDNNNGDGYYLASGLGKPYNAYLCKPQ